MQLITSLLNSAHDRSTFASGNASLDQYIKQLAKQDMKRKLANCFVLTGNQQEVLGYFTLSSSSIDITNVAEPLKKKLPKYDALPVILLGRLAIDKRLQGQGFGKLLVLEALYRSWQVSKETIGCYAVIVDPIDDHAARFYASLGFIRFQHLGKMFMPMAEIQQLFEGG